MGKFLNAAAIFLVAATATLAISCLALIALNGEKADARQERLPAFDMSDIPYEPKEEAVENAVSDKGEDIPDESEGRASDLGIFSEEALRGDEESVEWDDAGQMEFFEEDIPSDEPTAEAELPVDHADVGMRIEESEETGDIFESNEAVERAYYTNDELLFQGEIYDGDTRYTYYSESVLPGGGLDIPGRHVEDGYVMDENGNVCVASCDYESGTQLEVPFGNGTAVVYDECPESGTVDIYVE